VNSKTKYIILSLILPAIFFIVAFSPEELLGCYTRGLTAVLIAILSELIGLGIIIKGLVKRITGETNILFVICGLILSIPAIYIAVIA